MKLSGNIAHRQQLYLDLFIGTLIYSVVFGFFNDYTDVLTTSSYSITFLAALAMQFMTYPTFKLKSWIVDWFMNSDLHYKQIGMVVCVWLVMFLSKFVYLEAIDLIFGPSVEIKSFVGLVMIILTATALIKLNDKIFAELADN